MADEPTFYCPYCQDGFWEVVYCPGSGHLRADEKHLRYAGLVTNQCMHPRPHREHSAARKCTCIDSNPAIAQQRARQEAFVAGRKDKGR